MNPSGTLRVTTHTKPHIVYDNVALQKLLYLVQNWDLECQWYHRLDKEFSNGQLIYRVHDIFIPPQKCKAAEIDTDGGQLREMWQEVREKRQLENKELGELTQNTTVWCHSHVNMEAKPSGQDEAQWEERLEQASRATTPRPQAMLIFNKKGEYFSRIYDPDFNTTFEWVPIVVDHGIDFSDINDALDNKLEEVIEEVKAPEPYKPSGTNYGSRSTAGYGHKSHHQNWHNNKSQPARSTGGQSGNSAASSTGSRSSSPKSGGGSAALRGKIIEDTKDIEDWERALLKDNIMRISSSLMNRLIILVKEINKTGAPTKVTPLVEELATVLEGELVNGEDSWFAFRSLSCSESGSDVDILVDWYLKSEDGREIKPENEKMKFMEHIATMSIEPPEKLAKALQVVTWLDLASDPDIIEGLVDKWIYEYHPEYYSDESDDNDNSTERPQLGGSGYVWGADDDY